MELDVVKQSFMADFHVTASWAVSQDEESQLHKNELEYSYHLTEKQVNAQILGTVQLILKDDKVVTLWTPRLRVGKVVQFISNEQWLVFRQ